MLVCSECAQDNPARASTCSRCGTRLTAADYARGVTQSTAKGSQDEGQTGSPTPSAPSRPREPSSGQTVGIIGAAGRQSARTPPNEFEVLALPGLASTAELRRLHEHGRIRRALGSGGVPDAKTQAVEKLLNDPLHRIQEASAWFFRYATAEEADAGDEGEVTPHDCAVANWHAIRQAAASGEFHSEELEEACESTVELLNNPVSWQPLETLIREIGDIRVNAVAVQSVALETAAQWISEALIAIAGAGNFNNAKEAADIVLDEGIDVPDEVIDRASVSFLAAAAAALTTAAAEYQSRVVQLGERIEDDPSVAGPLADAADELAAWSRPWAVTVDALDDDPYSGPEGHALDHVATLLRETAISLFNHSDEDARAERLLQFANEISQSLSLKSSLQNDSRQVAYQRALAQAIEAFKAGQFEAAERHLAAAHLNASSDEERFQAERLRVIIRQRRSAPLQRQPVAGATGSGCGTIIAAIVAIVTIVSIAAAVIGSSGDSSSSPSPNGSGSGQGGVPARPPNSNSTSREEERQAIGRERARLEGVDSDLVDLADEIDALARNLEALAAQYPNGAPSYIVAQYEADVLRHDALVREYNDLAAEYESDEADLNRRIDAYNAP